MMTVLRVAALAWGDTVMEASFFIMQNYLTEVWNLSFTSAAAFLNIWGGVYKILPIFFLFLADNILGNFVTLALSGIFSTTGLVLITVATLPESRCRQEEVCDAAVGQKEKVMLMIGMGLIALGRAARFASTEPFMEEQQEEGPYSPCGLGPISVLVFMVTPAVGILVFPYVKKWYVLFGVSAICTALATLFYLSGTPTYHKPGPKPEDSPITDFFRVFVASALKIFRPFPADQRELHVTDGQEFYELSSSRILGFLHKASIILPGDRNEDGEVKIRSWKVCTISEVESVKIIIRLVPVWCSFVLCSVISSIGNTYFIEQASHMNTKIGNWKAPVQLLLLIFMIIKSSATVKIIRIVLLGSKGVMAGGTASMISSTVCCAVAAAIERRRLHAVTRHVSMRVTWLYFQFAFLASLEVLSEFGLSALHWSKVPKSMKRYWDYFGEGVSGLGFICGALSVYVVGKISERGDGKNWFQPTLNGSRLDRYYWVLTALSSVNLVLFVIMVYRYRFNDDSADPDIDDIGELIEDVDLARRYTKKSSAMGILTCYLPWRNHNMLRHTNQSYRGKNTIFVGFASILGS